MGLKKEFFKSKPTCKVTFTLPKEAVNGAKVVELVGNWQEWNTAKAIPMKSLKSEFKAVVELNPGRDYEFRYLIDGITWENDWQADGYRPTPFGVDNSVLVIPQVVEVADVPTKKAPVKKAPVKKATTAKKSTTARKTTPAKKTTTTAKKATVKRAPAKKTTTAKAAPVKKAATAKTTTAKKVTKKVVKNNDLTKIEGIGPKIKELLNKAGIVTFTDLSKSTIKNLEAILKAAGKRYQMHKPNSWPKQAKLAATGKWEALAKLQEELVGGR